MGSALEYLKSFLAGAEASLDYLESLSGTLERLDLFRTFFPEEFATAAPGALRRNEETAHRAGEVRFLELINASLFPVDDRIMEFEGGLGTVPVEAHINEHPETVEDVEWMKLGHRVGVVLMNFPDVGMELLECLPLGEEALAELRLASPNTVDFDLLGRLCAAENGPIRYLATSLRSARRDTGNVFFDGLCMCGQCGSEVEWSEENLRYLAEAWLGAQELFAEIDEFHEWLEVDPVARLAQVFELWNRAAAGKGEAS